LAKDETDLLLFTPLRAGWPHRGEPAKVLLSGRNARRVVVGTLNLRTGRRLFLVRPRQRAEDFQEFLRLVHLYDRGWHVALLLDEDSSHTARGSWALAAQFDIECLCLPQRAPVLNPLDSLWGQLEHHITKHALRDEPHGSPLAIRTAPANASDQHQVISLALEFLEVRGTLGRPQQHPQE
jgi:hypothetical protein